MAKLADQPQPVQQAFLDKLTPMETLDAIGNSEADLTAKQALEDAYNSKVDQRVFDAQAATYAKTFRIARTIATMLAMWPSNTEAGRKHARPPKRKAEKEARRKKSGNNASKMES